MTIGVQSGKASGQHMVVTTGAPGNVRRRAATTFSDPARLVSHSWTRTVSTQRGGRGPVSGHVAAAVLGPTGLRRSSTVLLSRDYPVEGRHATPEGPEQPVGGWFDVAREQRNRAENPMSDRRRWSAPRTVVLAWLVLSLVVGATVVLPGGVAGATTAGRPVPVPVLVVAQGTQGPCGDQPCPEAPVDQGPCGVNPCPETPTGEGPCGAQPCPETPVEQDPCGGSPCPATPAEQDPCAGSTCGETSAAEPCGAQACPEPQAASPDSGGQGSSPASTAVAGSAPGAGAPTSTAPSGSQAGQRAARPLDGQPAGSSSSAWLLVGVVAILLAAMLLWFRRRGARQNLR